MKSIRELLDSIAQLALEAIDESGIGERNRLYAIIEAELKKVRVLDAE